MDMGGQVAGSYVPAGPAGDTAVPGVRVAGNVADLKAQVISSAAAGLNTAAAINADLVEEDAGVAVAGRWSSPRSPQVSGPGGPATAGVPAGRARVWTVWS
jgi:hypothetical protein